LLEGSLLNELVDSSARIPESVVKPQMRNGDIGRMVWPGTQAGGIWNDGRR
jgi:hypothetical protein